MRAKQLGGEIKYLRQGEIDARNRGYSPYSTETWRAWEYWANKAGCGHMLTKPDHAHEHEEKERDESGHLSALMLRSIAAREHMASTNTAALRCVSKQRAAPAGPPHPSRRAYVSAEYGTATCPRALLRLRAGMLG